jgi:hypothetical protein
MILNKGEISLKIMPKRMDLTHKIQKIGICSLEKRCCLLRYLLEIFHFPFFLPLLFLHFPVSSPFPLSFPHQPIFQQGIGGVISHHNHSVAKALVDLFPNIGIDRNKLLARQCIHLFLLCLFLSLFPSFTTSFPIHLFSNIT